MYLLPWFCIYYSYTEQTYLFLMIVVSLEIYLKLISWTALLISRFTYVLIYVYMYTDSSYVLLHCLLQCVVCYTRFRMMFNRDIHRSQLWLFYNYKESASNLLLLGMWISALILVIYACLQKYCSVRGLPGVTVIVV